MSTDLTVKSLMVTDITFVGLMFLLGNFPMATRKQEGDVPFLITKDVPFSDTRLLKFEKLNE